MKPRYDHTIRWLQYTSNCNFPLWKLKELRVKVVSILGEGGEGALSSERWGDPAILARVCQLRAAPWCATISWPACLLATHTRSSCTFSLTLSVKSSQVNWRQALRENYCACSWSLSSKNDKKMISCARVYWICHLDSWIFHPGLCFISFQKKFNYPVPSHFQFSGRDGSGTWKKVRDGSGTGIPSDPARQGSKHNWVDCLAMEVRGSVRGPSCVKSGLPREGKRQLMGKPRVGEGQLMGYRLEPLVQVGQAVKQCWRGN